MKRLTMKDIAALAGVSPATVSRSVHSPQLISPDTLENIRRIMDKHHYVYDATAGDLSRKRTSVLGLIIPTLRSSIFASSTYGFQERAQEAGFTVIIANSDYNEETEADLIRLFQERRVAGLALTGLTSSSRALVNDLSEQGIPCVVTWETLDGEPVSYVGFDNFKAAYAAVDYLIGLKHKKIGAILGPFHRVERVRKRLAGYCKALEDHNIPYDPDLVIEKDDYSLIGGKEAMSRLLALPSTPTAVFAASDVLAMGALRAIKEKGLRVPDDISLVGFDDIDFSEYCDPPLTTVRVPKRKMGQIAMNILLELIEKRSSGLPQYCLSTDLIVRESCCQMGSR